MKEHEWYGGSMYSKLNSVKLGLAAAILWGALNFHYDMDFNVYWMGDVLAFPMDGCLSWL